MDYNIICRYQYWGPSGIQWTHWYVYESGFKTKTEGENRMATLVANSKNDKLKQEYKLVTDDEIKDL
jgi:hypothetical protein